MKSDPVLKKWYRTINKRFFDNTLTNSVCVRWANEDDDGDLSKCEDRFFGWADKCQDGHHEYVIVLSKSMNVHASTRLTTLAHEICHIASGLKDSHGPAFSVWHEHLVARGFFTKGALIKGLTIF